MVKLNTMLTERCSSGSRSVRPARIWTSPIRISPDRIETANRAEQARLPVPKRR